jgi:hypothetical protein
MIKDILKIISGTLSNRHLYTAQQSLRKQKLLRVVWVGLIGLTVLFISVLIWQSRDILIEAFRTARYGYFAWMFVFYTVSVGMVALGWHLVMHHLGAQSDLTLNIKIYMYTLVTRRLPGTLWYIAGRTVLYQQLGISGRASALASAIEIVLSIVAGLMVGAPALLLQIGTIVSIALLVSVELVGFGLLYPKVLCWLLARFGYPVASGHLTMTKVLSWLGAYIVMWVSGGLMMCMVILAFYPLDLFHILKLTSLWALVGAVSFVTFILPNNLGISEITLSVLLSQFIPLSIAIVTVILIRVLTTLFDLGWSSLFLLEKKLYQPNKFDSP